MHGGLRYPPQPTGVEPGVPELPWAVAVSTLAKGQRAAPKEGRHCHLHTHHSPAQPGLLHPLAECLAGPPCPRPICLLGTDTLTENNPVPRSPLALLPGTCPRAPLPRELSQRYITRWESKAP